MANDSGMGTMGNIIAIIGFVIVIAVVIWGAVAAIRLSPRLFETITSTFRGNNAIELSLPQSGIISNDPFVLSWKDSKRSEGLYTIRYGCVSGLSIDAPISATEFGPMPCDTPYAIPATESSLRLIPKLSGIDRAEFPITIAYLTSAGEKRAEGTATVSVSKSAPVSEHKPAPTAPEKPAEKKPAVAPAKPAGTPDLSARFMTIGVVDPYTVQFIPKTVFGSYETVTVRIDVANIGTVASGPWSFAVDLPTRIPTGYIPPRQNSIGPGGHTELTLNFTQPISGPIQVNIDSGNAVAEMSEANNSLTDYISVAY